MHNAPLTAEDLQPLVDKLSAAERLRLAHYALQRAHAPTEDAPSEDAPPPAAKRRPGLHHGAATTSDDFDAPLPDAFWLGSP